MTEARKCPECGKPMVFHGYTHKEKVGRNVVTDATGPAWQCACGEVELSLDELAGYQRRAAAIVLREAPKVDGVVVKYARRAIGMTQKDLAARIGCEPETLSRYETRTTNVPTQVRLAVVAVLEGVERAGGLAQYLGQQGSDARSYTFEVLPLRRACG